MIELLAMAILVGFVTGALALGLGASNFQAASVSIGTFFLLLLVIVERISEAVLKQP